MSEWRHENIYIIAYMHMQGNTCIYIYFYNYMTVTVIYVDNKPHSFIHKFVTQTYDLYNDIVYSILILYLFYIYNFLNYSTRKTHWTAKAKCILPATTIRETFVLNRWVQCCTLICNRFNYITLKQKPQPLSEIESKLLVCNGLDDTNLLKIIERSRICLLYTSRCV